MEETQPIPDSHTHTLRNVGLLSTFVVVVLITLVVFIGKFSQKAQSPQQQTPKHVPLYSQTNISTSPTPSVHLETSNAALDTDLQTMQNNLNNVDNELNDTDQRLNNQSSDNLQ